MNAYSLTVLSSLKVEMEERVWCSFTKAPSSFSFFFFLFVHFGSRHSALHFLMQGLFKAVTYQERDAPSLPSPEHGLRFQTQITYLLCYVNEGAAGGLEWAMFCARQKERDPINTETLDQRTFYYETHSFLKTVNMMNFSLQLNLWR